MDKDDVKVTEKKKKNKDVEVNNKIKELEDALLRTKADSINYRKRKDEEVINLLKYSNEELIIELLEVLDSLESCIKMDDNDLTDEVSKYLVGIKMIYCNLINVLMHYGVKEIDGTNKLFNPQYHQAVLTEKRDGVEPGMVLEIMRKGYLYIDKVIRPAMVKVSE